MKKLFFAGTWGTGLVLWLLFLGFSRMTGGETEIAGSAEQDVVGIAAPDFPRQETGAHVDSAIGGVPAAEPRDSRSAAKHDPVCVNVNTAAAGELDGLSGIGPVLAERIIEERTVNGLFGKADDLLRVKGIGPSKLEKIRHHICF